MRTISEWLQIIPINNNHLKERSDVPCPNCRYKEIQLLFFGKYSAKYVGLLIWCDSCHEGVHISTVKLPIGAEKLLKDIDTEAEEVKNCFKKITLVD